MSKAFERSRKTPTENSPRSKAAGILSCKSISASAGRMIFPEAVLVTTENVEIHQVLH